MNSQVGLGADDWLGPCRNHVDNLRAANLGFSFTEKALTETYLLAFRLITVDSTTSTRIC